MMKMTRADDGEDRLERVGDARAGPAIRTGLSGQVSQSANLCVEQVRQRAREERDHPEAGDQPPLQPRPEPSLREREQQVDEGGEEEAAEQSGEREHPAVVALVETRWSPRATPTRTSSRPVPLSGCCVHAIRPLITNESAMTGRTTAIDDRVGVVARSVAEIARADAAISPSRTGNSPSQSRWRGSSVLADQRSDGRARELALRHEPAGAARLDERAEVAGRRGSRRARPPGP